MFAKAAVVLVSVLSVSVAAAWAQPAPEGNVDIAFVVDDTGSMSQEIAGVRDGLAALIDEVPPGRFQLVTFKDDVTLRAPTTDLNALRTDVAGLFASGGGDCPEASADALVAVEPYLRDGGRIFLFTDASSRPGTSLEDAIATLRERSIRVDVLLSGDCYSTTPTESLRPLGGETFAANEGCVSRNDGPALRIATAPAVEAVEAGAQPRVPRIAGLSALDLGYFDSEQVALPFAFPFGGKSYSSLYVNSFGAVSFGEPAINEAFSGSLRSGPRVIAPLWSNDVYPPAGGTISVGAVGDDFVVDFDQVALFVEGSIDFTLTLRADGSFAIEYGASSLETSGVETFIGVAQGLSDPGTIDLSAAAQPIDLSAGIVREVFHPGTLDLVDTTLELAPMTHPAPLQARFIAVVSSGLTLRVTDASREEPETWSWDFGDGETAVGQAPSPHVYAAEGSYPVELTVTKGAESSTSMRTVTVTRTALDQYSSLAADTGGVFVFVPEVNQPGTGPQRYAAAVQNLVSGAVAGSIVAASPARVPRGSAVTVSIFGSGAAFTEVSTVAVVGGGVDAAAPVLLSPSQLRVAISVAPGAALGFRDVVVQTAAGQVVGGSVLEVVDAVANPVIVGVSPPSARAGERQRVEVSGAGTHFTDLSLPYFGSGITVLGVDALSATRLDVELEVTANAVVGLRSVSVTTGGETAASTGTPPFLVVAAPAAAPRIISVAPAAGVVGSSTTVTIIGENTSFAAGVSTVDLGPGIVVDEVSVQSATMLHAGVSIAPEATIGYRDAKVTTGDELAVGLDRFLVLPYCQPSATELCLQDSRFRIAASWRRPDGATGEAQVVQLTADTGYLWFFRESNVEAVVKVLDGCPSNDRFWVFAGGLTNVEVELRVTDMATGEEVTYVNPLRTQFAPIQDTAAFATCAVPSSSVRTADSVPAADWWRRLVGEDPQAAAAAGSVNRALGFTGTELVSVPDADSLDLDGDFTIEAWVRPDGTISNGLSFVVSKNLGLTGYTLLLGKTGNQMYPAFEVNREGNPQLNAPSSPLPNNQWSHLAGVWEDGTARLYVDGVMVAEESLPSPPLANTFPLYLGSSPFGDWTFLRGQLDEVRIWSRARSGEEIAALADVHLTETLLADAVADGLVAYWGFDDTDPLADAAGGNDGSFGSPPAAVVDNPDLALACATTMCLNQGRFELVIDWQRPNGAQGVGRGIQLTDDTGYFWFFNQSNVEVVTKVLAACTSNDRYWVFAGGLTNVATEMTVRDLATGAVKTYTNPQRTPFEPLQDTAAFDSCP